MARKPIITIGSRIKHNTNSDLSEGVVVFINDNTDKPYSVHWNNDKIKRGYYNTCEISKINPLTVLKNIRKEIEEDDK